MRHDQNEIWSWLLHLTLSIMKSSILSSFVISFLSHSLFLSLPLYSEESEVHFWDFDPNAQRLSCSIVLFLLWRGARHELSKRTSINYNYSRKKLLDTPCDSMLMSSRIQKPDFLQSAPDLFPSIMFLCSCLFLGMHMSCDLWQKNSCEFVIFFFIIGIGIDHWSISPTQSENAIKCTVSGQCSVLCILDSVDLVRSKCEGNREIIVTWKAHLVFGICDVMWTFIICTHNFLWLEVHYSS